MQLQKELFPVFSVSGGRGDTLRCWAFISGALQLETPRSNLGFISTCWAQATAGRAQPVFVQRNAILPQSDVKPHWGSHLHSPRGVQNRGWPVVTSADKIQEEETITSAKDAN